MGIRRILAATCAAAAMLGAAAPAFAGGYYYYSQAPGYVVYHTHDGRMLYLGRDLGGYVDRYNWPTPYGHCIRMCASDNLPCDPIYFKVADGRCTTNAR